MASGRLRWRHPGKVGSSLTLVKVRRSALALPRLNARSLEGPRAPLEDSVLNLQPHWTSQATSESTRRPQGPPRTPPTTSKDAQGPSKDLPLRCSESRALRHISTRAREPPTPPGNLQGSHPDVTQGDLAERAPFATLEWKIFGGSLGVLTDEDTRSEERRVLICFINR